MLMLKERFKRFREDSKILLVMTIMPLIITYFFTGGEKEFKIAIVQGVKKIKIDEDFVVLMNKKQAIEALEMGKIDGILSLEGKKEFITKEKNYSFEFVKKIFIKKLKEEKILEYLNEISEENIQEIPELPIQIEKIARITDSGEEKTKTLLGFMVFFAMYPISYSIANILQEKKEGTWQRQITSPLKKSELIGANLIYSSLLGLIQIYTIIIAAKYIFKVNFQGNFILILMLFSLFVICIASMSLMLTTIVKSESQLTNILPIITTASAMLAGCFWPFELVSNKILIVLGYMMPQRWIIDGIYKVGIKSGNISLIFTNILVLLGMTTIFFLIASRKGEES